MPSLGIHVLKKHKTGFPVYLFQEKDAQNPNHFIVWQSVLPVSAFPVTPHSFRMARSKSTEVS